MAIYYRRQTIRVPTDERELAYVAGLFDGEGSISYVPLDNGHGSWKLTITNTSWPMHEWLIERIGGGVTDMKHNRVPCWQWRLNRQKDVFLLMEAIRPYLVIKRDRVELALESVLTKFGGRHPSLCRNGHRLYGQVPLPTSTGMECRQCWRERSRRYAALRRARRLAAFKR